MISMVGLPVERFREITFKNTSAVMMTQNTPEVSVVIPTYNRANLIGRAIKSVLKQNLQNFEIIIVDDASTDNTAEVIQEFVDARIRYIPLEKNCGGGHARNQGIKAARAEFIAFLDSDDEWMPEKLELQVARLVASNDSNATVVYCQGYEYYESLQEKKIRNVEAHEGDVFKHLLKGWLPPTTSLFMVKRSALIDVDGFDESLPSFQDIDLWFKLAQNNNHFVAVNKPLIIRYFHGNQIVAISSKNLVGAKIFQEKWGHTIKNQVGWKAYRNTIESKICHLYFMEFIKATNKGDSLKSFNYIFYLFTYMPYSFLYIIKMFVIILFGMKFYKTNIQKFRKESLWILDIS
jgi:glycosyltransferase involved in cell wall biosynthesis